MLRLGILILLFSLGPQSEGSPKNNCSAHLKNDFSGFLRTEQGRDLFVQVEFPQTASVQEPVFLIHGLLDSLRRYDDVTKRLLVAGHPVIRLDLYGFGQSLIHEIERNQGSLEFLRELPYQRSAADLRDVIIQTSERFGFSSMIAVGHSMGGGLLAAALLDQQVDRIVRRGILVAPYIYRLEHYHAESHFPPGFGFYDNPISRFWGRMLFDPMVDMVFLNQALKDQFTEHLDEIGKDAVLSEALVTSAVASVKGLRDLNVLNLIDDLPLDSKLDLVISTKDQLVPASFQRKLGARLMRRGETSRIFEVESNHMVPSSTPEQLIKVILTD